MMSDKIGAGEGTTGQEASALTGNGKPVAAVPPPPEFSKASKGTLTPTGRGSKVPPPVSAWDEMLAHTACVPPTMGPRKETDNAPPPMSEQVSAEWVIGSRVSSHDFPGRWVVVGFSPDPESLGHPILWQKDSGYHVAAPWELLPAPEETDEDGLVYWESRFYRLEWCGHVKVNGSELAEVGRLTTIGAGVTPNPEWERCYRLVPVTSGFSSPDFDTDVDPDGY